MNIPVEYINDMNPAGEVDTHLMESGPDVYKTLCGKSIHGGMTTGDETLSGIAANCMRCLHRLARMNAVGNVQVPEPQVFTRVSFTYPLTEEGVLVPSYSIEQYIVTEVRVIVEPEATEETGLFVTSECWGYTATSKGVRDKRSQGGRVYPDHEWRLAFEKDATTRYLAMGHPVAEYRPEVEDVPTGGRI